MDHCNYITNITTIHTDLSLPSLLLTMTRTQLAVRTPYSAARRRKTARRFWRDGKIRTVLVGEYGAEGSRPQKSR